jgi:acyl-CoA synthetase (AMP-forming)/AMP-acid ligase II
MNRAIASKVKFAAEYETMLAAASPSFPFPDLPEDTRATTFYTTGTTGLPKGVYYSHRQLVLHTLGVIEALASAPHATFTKQDVYMPVTPMFHVHAWGLPYVATMLGVKQVYPGRYLPAAILKLIDEGHRSCLDYEPVAQKKIAELDARINALKECRAMLAKSLSCCERKKRRVRAARRPWASDWTRSAANSRAKSVRSCFAWPAGPSWLPSTT